MGVLVSDPKDKIAYYRNEADSLRRRSEQVRRELGDLVEAKRLADLAKEADNQADALENQLHDLVNG